MACSDKCEYGCKTKREMRLRHGTPNVFADAVYAALGEISLDEAVTAIARYTREYSEANDGCQACGAEIAECMGSTLPSEFCLALDGKIPWAEVGQVCAKCVMLGEVLQQVGKPLETCTLEDYERLRPSSGITPRQV